MGKKEVTMSDVAALANVSQTTVSLVLNNKGTSRFPQSTIDSIYDAAYKLNYRFKTVDSDSSQMGTNTIMVFAVKMSNPYYSVMLHSIESIAANNNYKVLTCNTYHRPDYEARYLESALMLRYSGIIFLYPPDNISAFQATAAKMPCIAICDHSSKLNSDIMELNNIRSGQLAAEHLISLGHRHFSLFTYQSEGNTSRLAKIEGIKSVLKNHGYDNNLTVFSHNADYGDLLTDIHYDYHFGFTLADDPALYDKRGKSTAFICINDMLALGVIDALYKNNVRIPNDVSVIGFDNLLFSSLAPISLTTVDPHTSMVAQYAAELLFQKIRMQPQGLIDEVFRARVECLPTLVVRKSTGPCPT